MPSGIGAVLLSSAAFLLPPGSLHAQSTSAGATQLQQITVTEENANGPVNGIVAKKTATAGKTGRPILKTPQTVNVVGRDEMEQRGAQTVTEALRYTAGIAAEIRPNTRYDIGYIRGFGGLQNWFDFVDGMKMQRGISYNAPAMDAWNIERVEVLKGPASVLYGQIMPGGLVNQVTKKPQAEASNEVRLTIGAPAQLEAGFDFTGPVAGNDDVKYRLVGLGRYQESNVKFSKTERFFLAPSVTYDGLEDTSITLYGGYLNDPSSVYPVFLPLQGTILPNGTNAAIPYDFNVEGDNYSAFKREQAWLGYEINRDVTDSLSFTQKFRFMKTDTDFKGLAVTGISGTTLQRRASHTADSARQVTIDNQLKYETETGPIKHTLLGGFDYQFIDANRYLGQSTGTYGINYLNPVYTTIATPAYTTYHTMKRHQLGFYAQDQVDLGPIAATFGGRYDRVIYDYRANSYNAATGVITPASIGSTSQSVGDFTWNAGAAYQFANGVTPYASYATSFEVNVGTGLGGVAYKPTRAGQFEAGVKYQPDGFDGLFTFSYFDIEQSNVLTSTGITGTSANGCSASICQSQLGKVRSRGVELEGKAEVLPGLDLIASYAYVHARVTEDTDATLIGTTPAGVPTHQAGLWANYTFDEASNLGGLGIGGGIRYMGESSGSYLSGFVKVPSYTLVDAAISYDFGVKSPNMKGLKLTVSASNLFDRHYVASCGSSSTAIGTCYYGTGRVVKGVLSFKW
jgi:iron complex outermembrane receptor protein